MRKKSVAKPPKVQSDTSPKAYARAGVDIDLASSLTKNAGSLIKSTHNANVLGKIGGFGGLFSAVFSEVKEPVLVSSIDGVGTKLKIAQAMNRHGTIGQDLVNHCVNDIAVMGATPLFFLDYIGAGKLEPKVFQEVLHGLCEACKAAGCALIGGETAEMPGLYHGKDYDLVGAIVGLADREKMIDGQGIQPGDIILGLPSNGLHTNGYSLARKVLLDERGLLLDAPLPGFSKTLGEELLRVHFNYQPLLSVLSPKICKGLAHITGGGLIDNLPRILPPDCGALINCDSWQPQAIFSTIQKLGSIPALEMYQVFNMGIGMAIVASPKDVDEVESLIAHQADKLKSKPFGRVQRIGKVVSGNRQVQLLCPAELS